jgi:hypothetical protein
MQSVGWTSAKAVLKQVPRDLAALSRSSESYPVELEASLPGPSLVYIKRYWYPKFSKRLSQFFRGSMFGRHRAGYEFAFLEEMRRRGVPGARPIANGAYRKAGMLLASLLITEAHRSSTSLDQVALSHMRQAPLSTSRRHGLVASLAESIRHMHAAGVKHGALCWRNIVINPPGEAAERIVYIDPDTRGRFFRGPVPPQHAESDLADFFASALALEYRGDTTRFMQTYLGKPHLDDADRARIRRILACASERAAQERHRMAIADALSHVRKRMTPGDEASGPRDRATSLHTFFEKLVRSDPIPCDYVMGNKTVQFVFDGGSSDSAYEQCHVVIEDGRFTYREGPCSQPDLTIQTDEETWLSILNGDNRAMALLQKGRLKLKGDTVLAALLARHVGI